MSTENKPEQSPIAEELSNLGRKLGAAFRAAMSSPQRQEIEHDLREGFQTVVNEINEAMAKVRSTDVAKEVGEQASKAVGTVRGSKITQEMRDGLLKGLQTLNSELDQFIDKIQPGKAQGPDVAEGETTPPSPEESIDMEDPTAGQS